MAQVTDEIPARKQVAMPGKGLRIGCGAIALLVFLFLAGLRPFTDYLWFLHDAKHPEVFTLAYKTKVLLFLVAFVAALTLYAFSFIKALGVTMVYFREPQTLGEAAIAKAMAWIQTHGPV